MLVMFNFIRRGWAYIYRPGDISAICLDFLTGDFQDCYSWWFKAIEYIIVVISKSSFHDLAFRFPSVLSFLWEYQPLLSIETVFAFEIHISAIMHQLRLD
jgi:hypothetical protein